MITDPALRHCLELLARGHQLYGHADAPPAPIPAGQPPRRTPRARRLAADLDKATAADVQLDRLIGAAHADHARGRAGTRAVLDDARADHPIDWDTPLARLEATRRMADRLRRQHHHISASHRYARGLARQANRLDYRRAEPPGEVRRQIAAALDRLGIADPAARRRWIRGYQTLIARESSGRPSARAAAGTARGLTQTIPATFAHYHQPGTSADITDPVANICASMNYVMHRYGVHLDAANLAALVQQADPGRPPKGY